MPSSFEPVDAAHAIRAAWAASPQDYNEASGIFPPPPPLSLNDQSVRQVLRVSAGGSYLRVRVSNLFGKQPLALSAVQVANSRGGSAIDPQTRAALSFEGQAGLTVPPGGELWSDWLPFSVAAQADLAVSLHVPGPTAVATVHTVGLQTGYVTAGDAVALQSWPEAETIGARYWITGVEVAGGRGGPVIVTLGDSLTDGHMSSVDGHRRYPDLLAQRLAACGRQDVSVVNAGLSGNRLLTDRIGPCVLNRFERDALGQAGASHLIVLVGINDIGFGGFFPDQAVTAEQIQAGLAQLVDKARRAGLKVLLGTLTPFEGFRAPFVRPGTDATRQAVNAWIRTNQAGADGVLDVDALLRDPDAPNRLRPAYDSGDHAHPNDAGYAAIADGIELSFFDAVGKKNLTRTPS